MAAIYKLAEKLPQKTRINNMKKAEFILLLLLSNLTFGNTIDDLKTTKQVENFIKTVNKDFAKVRLDFDRANFRIESVDSIYSNIKCVEIFKSSEIKNWEKIDINNDGLTDLLFIPHYFGYSQYVIIDKGNESFQLIRLIDDFDSCEFIKPIKVENKNQIWIIKVIMHPFGYVRKNTEEENVKIDTLTFRYNSFIELNNKKIKKLKIESIEVKTSGCFGTSPVLELRLDKNGKAEFNGLGYTKFIGKSTSTIDLTKMNEIMELINYIEIKKLKDEYSVNWTDDMTINLKIKFKDGLVKEINDYGLRGTFGLTALYNKLIKIGTETEWK